MPLLSGESDTPADDSQKPHSQSRFTEPTAEVKRKNLVTGLLFLAIVLLFLSISIWRRFLT